MMNKQPTIDSTEQTCWMTVMTLTSLRERPDVNILDNNILTGFHQQNFEKDLTSSLEGLSGLESIISGLCELLKYMSPFMQI